MRRMIGGIALAAALGLGLTACGGSSTPKSSTTTTTGSTTTSVPATTATSGAAAAASPACQKVEGILSKINAKLPSAASNPKALKSAIQQYAGQLNSAVANASPTLKSQVQDFISELQAAGNGNVNIQKLEGTAGKIGQTCSAGSTTSTT